MFGIAFRHRLTRTQWIYRGEAVEFSDDASIVERLKNIDSLRQNLLQEKTEEIQKGEYIYASVQRAVDLFRKREFIQYVLMCYWNGKSRNLAHGSGIVGLGSGEKGFLTLNTLDFTTVVKSYYINGVSGFDGGESVRVRWSREESDDFHTTSFGEVSVQSNNSSAKLRLIFPPRVKEGGAITAKIQVFDNDLIVGEARRFGKLFEPGFRLNSLVKGELPIFRALTPFSTRGYRLDVVLVACVGIVYCYSPLEGFQG